MPLKSAADYWISLAESVENRHADECRTRENRVCGVDRTRNHAFHCGVEENWPHTRQNYADDVANKCYLQWGNRSSMGVQSPVKPCPMVALNNLGVNKEGPNDSFR